MQLTRLVPRCCPVSVAERKSVTYDRDTPEESARWSALKSSNDMNRGTVVSAPMEGLLNIILPKRVYVPRGLYIWSSLSQTFANFLLIRCPPFTTVPKTTIYRRE